MSCQGCTFAGQSTAVEDTHVGVRFAEETNLTLCRTRGEVFCRGDQVVVSLDDGPAFGRVEKSPMPVFKPCQKSSARELRRATQEDQACHERQLQAESRGRRFCEERARSLRLRMKIARVDFSLDGKRATFYFTAEGRVDFRQLVRDLSRRFSARVRMVQVGARDEAKLLGGVGICGLTLCCSTWLDDFRPISIQMAKRQDLSLNPSKISGQCGRLLCCLAYEDEQYKSRGQGRANPGAAGEHSKPRRPRTAASVPATRSEARSKNPLGGDLLGGNPATQGLVAAKRASLRVLDP